MIKFKIALLALFSLWMVSVNAQPPHGGPPRDLSPEKREKIEALKVAFFTRKLDLTADEAKVFWPVYNQFQEELHVIRDDRRKEMRSLKEDAEDKTDKDYEKIFDSEVTFRQAEIDVMKKYQVQLKKTLPIKKLARIHRLEDEFKRELLDMIRDREGDKAPQQRKKRG